MLLQVLRPIGLCAAVAAGPALAEETPITESLPRVEITVGGAAVVITRQTDAADPRPCPPACLKPMRVMRAIAPVGELEVLEFLQDKVAAGTGVLIDARLPEGFAAGSVPGAVNVPFATLDPQNPFRNDILAALGGKPTGGDTFDFSAAMDILVFCDSAMSGDSAQALRFLRDAGYPAEKILHYRGGMRDWRAMGLTVAATAGN